MKKQREDLKAIENQFHHFNNKDFYDTKKSNDEMKKAMNDVEGDYRKNSNNQTTEAQTHYDHKMHQWIEVEERREIQERHDLYVKLMQELIVKKEVEEQKVITDQKKIDDDFAKWKEYQDRIKEI